MATPAPAPAKKSAPAPAPAPAAPTTQISTGTAAAVGGVAIVYWVLLAIFLLFFHLGGAKLSYDLHQSGGWAFLSFLFASIYYPYYAFMYSTRKESSFFGGRKSRK